MSKTTCQISVSLDGFAAGPNQSDENPLGERGEELHTWHIGNDPGEDDKRLSEQMLAGNGAYVIGRNMFTAGRGEWDLDWKGWWGDDPPYHAPTYVLTHYEREPVEMEGGTTFYFVTGGLESALAQAREAAGELNTAIFGGASVVRQALAAGEIEELMLHISPVLLGSGERLFEDLGELVFEPVETIHSPLATHVRYRIGV